MVARTQLEMFERTPRGNVYVPFQQGYVSNAFFHVRPAGPAGATLVDAVRREVRDAAPGVPLFTVRTFADHLDASAEYWTMRLSSGLLLFFGLMAMVVALVGIYGVTAYTVSRRTREIGVRMAIGARPGEVLALIMRESAVTLAAGVALGWLLGARPRPPARQPVRRHAGVRPLGVRARAHRLRPRRRWPPPSCRRGARRR